jgi:hypothetical protein
MHLHENSPGMKPGHTARPTSPSPFWRHSDYAASLAAITASQAGLAVAAKKRPLEYSLGRWVRMGRLYLVINFGPGVSSEN